MTTLEVAHIDAGHTLLTDAGLTVYDGKLPAAVTSLALPYVLSYTSVEWEFDNPNGSINHESSTCCTTWYLHCVAANNEACMAVVGRVRAALLDVVPVISGRVCGLIRMVSVQPPQRDETLGTAVLDAIATYELETRPA